MAAITASGVTYTPQGKGPGNIDDNGVRELDMKIVFGDGSSTYPSGGIPLSGLSSWGFPYSVGSVIITDASNSDGYVYKWDKATNTIRIYNTLSAHTHSLYLANGAVSDGTTTRVNAGTNLLGANTGSSLTVAGIAAASGAAGGVVNAAAAAGSEVTTAFVPAANTTLYAYIRGH